MSIPMFIKTRHVAAAANTTPQTIRNHRLRGLLPPYDYDASRQTSGWSRETIRTQAPKVYALLEIYFSEQSA